jgi:cytochrome c-type biogenesis protein CcmH/NrfF
VARLLLVALLLLAALAGPAAASGSSWTIDGISQDLMCPTCHEPLAMSSSPEADQIRAHLRQYQRQGLSQSQAERQLVLEYGNAVLASPPKSGFGLAAWLTPVVLLVAGGMAAGAIAWRWSHARRGEQRTAATPAIAGPQRADLERRLDAELERFE